jgi:phosphatidylinositol alpha-1,6-mannosyltransferase
MMRVIIISSEFPPGPGGIGTHAFNLAQNLFRLGWEVEVVTSQNYASPEEISHFNSEQVFPIRCFKEVPYALIEGVYRFCFSSFFCLKQRPDILLASGQRSVWLTALLSRCYGLPWIAVGHGTEFGTSLRWERQLARWAYDRANCVICVSNYTRQRMMALGIKQRAAMVIHNGADEKVFGPIASEKILEFRKRFALKDYKVILTVGNVTERKGQDIVIRALPDVISSIQNIFYLIIGLPTRKAELYNLANSLGLEDRVMFLGKVDQQTLVAAYNICDIYVMTSRQTGSGDFEGYGIAAIEAALCEKPAVVSAGSGLEEAILADETGLVVPEDNPPATARAIVQLLTDSQLCHRLGRQARARALRSQTWEACAQRYDQVMRELVSWKGFS